MPKFRRRLPHSVCASLCLVLLLAGCGTNLKWLLKKEGENAWRAESLIERAEAEDPAALDEFLAAEERKREDCEDINSAVQERVARVRLPFWEQFYSDTVLLVALIFPIPTVERCADAHQSYDEALHRLQERLPGDDVQESRS